MPDPLKAYTTTIAPEATLAELQRMLGAAGARRVMVEYGDGEPVAVSFSLDGPHGERLYTLPSNPEQVLIVLRADHKVRRSHSRTPDLAQARRVSWRLLRDWVDVQVALIRTHMATMDQVMLPYLHVDRDTTLYEAWVTDETRALPPAR